MISSTFKNQMTMVKHGQIPDVQTFKSIPLGDEHSWTMVNHGWTRVSDHGWPWAGNVLTMIEPWLTMVMLNQATMVWPWSTMVSSTFKNQMTMVNHGQIPDAQTFKLIPLGDEHGWTMVNHGWTRVSNYGQPWSVPHSKTKWPWSIMVKYLMSN